MDSTSHGMLFVATDVGAADEADFNDWYDREHVEERARVEGFISAARYQSVRGGKRYLGLYRTASLAAFTSPAYQAAFGRQTAWSITNLGRMLEPMRRVCAVTAVVGQGSGSWLSVLTMNPAAEATELAAHIASLGRQLAARPGFVQSYLLVPDDALSTPLPRESVQGRQLLALLVIETSSAEANDAALAQAQALLGPGAQDAACYALKWKLFSQELAR
ncbi:hypothetical protein ABLV49_20320 [Polaromonas hydrogenivorans]|uniref:Uncharacterized protein n=1 Tax=Polaromonas hydrogenivorans TaxID=335476 RepID=A0AAU7LRC3_9BURK